MEPIKQQQTTDEFIGSELIENAKASGLGLGDDIHHPFQSSAVKLHQRLHELERARLRVLVGQVFNLANQSLDPLHPLLDRLVFSHSSWVSATQEVRIKRGSFDLPRQIT